MDRLLEIIKTLLNKYREIISYLIVGGLTTVVSMATYYLCVFTFLNPKNPFELQVANVISWVFAVAFAYITNRKFVFKSKEKNFLKETFSFVSSRVGTLLIDMLLMFLIVSVGNMNDKIAKILVQIVVIVLNYVFAKFFVFRKESEGK